MDVPCNLQRVVGYTYVHNGLPYKATLRAAISAKTDVARPVAVRQATIRWHSGAVLCHARMSLKGRNIYTISLLGNVVRRTEYEYSVFKKESRPMFDCGHVISQ